MFPRPLPNKITTLVLLFFAVLLTPKLDSSAADAGNTDRANVLLILTDDQGWGDLGIHGNEILSTPTLDHLAEESVRLDRFYVSPVCAPTRAALLTGRYPERSGVAGVTSRREVMRESETTLAEVFRDAGYATGCFGKWHNGAQMPLHPNGQGFDQFFGFCGGHFNLYDNPLLERNGIPVQTKGYITDVITDAAIEFIEQQDDGPFLCYVPFNAPHGPFQVRKDLFDKYNDGQISEKTAAVYAMVENLDTNVARLLKTLEQRNLSDHTIVLFLTDNGPNGKRFNGGMRGAKGSVHEGGCRVPCLIRWPEKLKPRTIDQITAHIDLLPTLAALCEVDLPETPELDGRDLTALLLDGADDQRKKRSILTYRPNKNDLTQFGRAAVRTNQYRLTIENGKASLFDMTADPGQRTDVAGEHPETTNELKSQIDQYFESIRPSIIAPRDVPVTKGRPTFIPSVDAILTGQPGYADGISWAHSWVDNWVSKDDVISWPLRVAESGRYQITLHYVCSGRNTAVSAEIGGERLTKVLRRANIESRIRPDLDSRSTPRRMLTFRQQSLGAVDLEAGEAVLELTRESDGDMIELGGVTLTSADLPPEENFHLFLLAGQSNMAGRGKVLPQDRVPDERIMMLDRDGLWVPATDPLHFDKSVAGVGLGRAFARHYAARHPGVTVGLVPCAVGGSPIASWQPGGYHPQTKTHPYDDAVSRIEIAMKQGRFKGILWHQGESDCKPGLAEKYLGELSQVFGRFRERVGARTPILIGGLARRDVETWSDERKLVDQTHRALAEELPRSAFVDSGGLTLKSDNVHFDRESLLEFGRRYAEAYERIE